MGRGMTSEEHEEVIKNLSKRWNIEIVTIRGNKNIKGMYFPDLKSDDTDYEVEVVPRKHYLAKKKDKWDSSRKKVLILKVNSFATENFDEVYVFDKELIKLR